MAAERDVNATRELQRPDARRILGTLYVGRLCVTIAVFLAAVWGWRYASPDATLAATLALAIGAAFTAASYWWSHMRGRAPGENFLYGQLVFDTALVTVVVHLTGGQFSAFAPLYILVIFAGALLLPFLGGVLIGLLASILYFASMVWVTDASLTGGVVLQAFLFAVVALVTGSLGDRLRQTGTVLGEVEAELRLLRLDTDEILGSMATGILTVDGNGKLAYINRAGSRILGLPLNQWLGRPILEKLDDVAPGMGSVIRRSRDRRRSIRRFETRSRSAGGRILGVSTTLMDREDGGQPTVTAILQDITESKRAEGLHRRSERLQAVAELSASLAHEIRNPLASIRSAVEQLASEGVPRGDRRVLEGLVLRESDRLSRLLTEFIDFSRVKVTAAAPVDLGALVGDAVALVRAHPDASGRSVEMEADPSGGPLLVEGDADLLHRAALNLVLNGVQWAGEGGRVRVRIDRLPTPLLAEEGEERDAIRLRVGDTGPGVPAAAAEQIFDPFVTTRQGGTGLGLALVQRAVEAHGGAVLLESAVVEGLPGANFTLLVPAASAATPAAPTPPTPVTHA
jgi:two-component system, NtrC family, sensor histidine kinase PilS